MNELVKVFENNEFGKIRMVVIDGKPYAVGIDVTRALEYANPSKAVIDHCKGITKLGIPSSGGVQETNVIPQGDIVRLITKAADQSKNETIKAKAKKFESWIFDEVIPQVLETGSYSVKQAPALPDFTNPAVAARAWAEQFEKRELVEKENLALTAQIETMKPKIDYTDKILQSSKTVPITLIAKDYGMSAQAMNKVLHDAHIIWKCDKQWVLYADYQGNGYAHSRTELNYNKYGEACGYHTQLEWTQKGRLFLYNFLKEKRHLLPIIERNEEENHAETD